MKSPIPPSAPRDRSASPQAAKRSQVGLWGRCPLPLRGRRRGSPHPLFAWQPHHTTLLAGSKDYCANGTPRYIRSTYMPKSNQGKIFTTIPPTTAPHHLLIFLPPSTPPIAESVMKSRLGPHCVMREISMPIPVPIAKSCHSFLFIIRFAPFHLSEIHKQNVILPPKDGVSGGQAGGRDQLKYEKRQNRTA